MRDQQHRLAPKVGQGEQRTARSVEVDPESREILFVASDETVDRYGDIIRVRGWSLASYQRNPVLLWGHDASKPPIGIVSALEISGTRLLARAKFLPKGYSAFADQLWMGVVAGAIRAVSVGFLPLAQPLPIKNSDGYVIGFEHIAQELIELSLVSVPANPSAIAVAKLSPEQVRIAAEHAQTRARIDRLAKAPAYAAAEHARRQAALDRLKASAPR